MLTKFPSVLNLWSAFIMKGMLNFVKCFSYIYWYDHVGFFPLFYEYGVSHYLSSVRVEPHWHNRTKSHMVWGIILFRIQFFSILLRIIVSIIRKVIDLLFSYDVFVRYWYQGNSSPTKWDGSLLFYFRKELWKIRVNFFLNTCRMHW